MSSNQRNYPNEFYCPITQEIMKDPVIGTDGQTYEREAIEHWLTIHATSPLTREAMSKELLVSNIALRNTIEQLVHGNTPIVVNRVTPLVEQDIEDHSLNLTIVSKQVSESKRRIHVKVSPPTGGQRQPCNLVCILDVSGSMGSSAEDLSSSNENTGFSRLDLVKHSVRTLIELMNEKDQISLIPFSDSARMELPLTKMDAVGKKKAIEKLEHLGPEGSTNVWDGLRLGMESSLNNPLCAKTNTCLILFTDGEPNINPPRGIVPTLEKYIKEHPLNSTIHSFGFGYSLDSALLKDIAMNGSGAYSYIPDCSMVGTTFVNMMSNILCTAVRRAELVISSMNGAKISHVYGSSQNGKNSTNEKQFTISMGGVQFQQSRDYIIDVDMHANNLPAIKVDLTYNHHSIEKVEPVNQSLSSEQSNDMDANLTRLMFIECVEKCIQTYRNGNSSRDDSSKECKHQLESFLQTIAKLPSFTDERVSALVRDIKSDNTNEGQVSIAFSKQEFMNKWGYHYLPSLLRANWMQQCHNFKDPSVQIFGGSLFEALQSVADDIFCKLPPPKPSNVYSYGGGSYNTPTNMSSYYNAGGSCFDGNSLITMYDNSVKKVSEIKKGDRVKNMNGDSYATILCVLKSKTPSPIVKLCEMNGMYITPYHPVRVKGEWKFPIDIKSPQDVACDYVYNLVVDQGHVVSINGVECITLGHGFTDNSVVSHPYFGTDQIVKDLSSMKGYDLGMIEMNKYDLKRDPNTKMIISLSILE